MQVRNERSGADGSVYVRFVETSSCIVDPLANFILWMAHRMSARAEEKKWPARGSRFESSELAAVHR
jgi:hypothetical protein